MNSFPQTSGKLDKHSGKEFCPPKIATTPGLGSSGVLEHFRPTLTEKKEKKIIFGQNVNISGKKNQNSLKKYLAKK